MPAERSRAMTTKVKQQEALVASLNAEAARMDPRDFVLTTPLHVLLGEAVDVARFCELHWEPQFAPVTGALLRPGLGTARGPAQLDKTIAEEILVLQQLVQQAQTAYVLATTPADDTTVARARFVLDEIAAALEWLFGNADDDEHAAQLAAIEKAHKDDPDSDDAMASELADYVGLAFEVKDTLAKIGVFDIALVEEARVLVASLRERSATRMRGATSKSALLIEHRNRLAAVLSQRMARVRGAARYVYRHHPDIVKQVTSAYQRRRRAAARRRASEAGERDEPPPE